MPIIISNKEIKHGIIGFAEATLGNFMRVLPVLNNVSRFKKDSLRIVYYHIVSSETREYYFDNKTISPKVFREHLAFFKKRFHIISLAEALQMVENKESLHGKLVLTFDDGFAENYTVIAPILKEQGITGTLFLIGNCIDNKDLMWRNKLVVIQKKAASKLPKLTSEAIRAFFLPSMRNKEGLLEWSFRTWPMNKKDEIANFIWDGADIGTIAEYMKEKKPYLTIEQIRYLLNEGFEIGSHSLSHPVFSRLSYDQFEEEIVTSAKLLEATFGKQITSFSYPFGMKACPEFEQRLVKNGGVAIKTLLGTKNRLNNYMNCLQWERDNLEFPMNKMLFRLNLLPLLRRLA